MVKIFSIYVYLQTLPSAIARQKKLAHGTESELLLPEDSLSSSAPTATQDDEVPPLRDLFTRPVRVALLNHAFLCFCQMCFDVLNPLVYATPIEMGGLGMRHVSFTHTSSDTSANSNIVW